MEAGIDWNKIIQEELNSYDDEMQSCGLDKTDFSAWPPENVEFLGIQRYYEKVFNERIGIPHNSYMSTKDFIEVMKQCIATNTPYEWPKLPEGCIA